jgi:hypothetical protein
MTVLKFILLTLGITFMMAGVVLLGAHFYLGIAIGTIGTALVLGTVWNWAP